MATPPPVCDPLNASSSAWRCAPASVGAHTPKKRKRDADGERVRRRDDETDEAFDPGDDSDLGLDTAEDDTSVGLDTSLGFEDTSDDFDLPEDGEDERWSTDSEEVGELPGADDELFGGEEYGWLGDDEPADDEAFDPGISDTETESTDDGGAEGVDEEAELDELDLGELPDIDADVEEDAAASGSEGIEELAGLSLIDEPSIEIAAGELWKIVPTRSVRISTITGLNAPVRALAALGSSLYVCADGLYTLSGDATELRILQLPAAGPSALALAEDESGQALAVVASGRVFTSLDAGQTFNAIDGLSGVSQVFYTRSAGGLRLWWRTVRGVLGASGNRVAPLPDELEGEVLKLHSDGRRSLVLLVRRQGRLLLAASGDAGRRFARQPAPPMAANPELTLQICRGAVLVADQTGARCAITPQGFEPVATLSRAPAALSDEDDEPFVYACVRRGDEWLIVRRTARAHGAPLVLAALDAQLVGEPRLLSASASDAGAVNVYVAGDRALLRIEVSLDGEELA